MKKKMFLSVAAAAAILAANPGLDKADASANCDTSVQPKVYYQSGNFSHDQINAIFQKFLNNRPIEFKQFNKQPVQKQVQQPAKAPQLQKQAPEKAQAPASAPAKAPATEQQSTKTTAPASSALSAYEQKVVELTNQERAKYGLKALAIDNELSKVAREKSRDMQSKGYFSHTSPTYGSPFDMMKKFGITYRSAGENIAMGQRSPEEVVKAWMNSDGHRKNILSSNFTHIGVGHVANGNYWTQMFIGK
ncbi:CAP domain-containing protein [Bacillus sp. REN3]|uniref:CAP domain-containing protein n=1 Tax=Bacillus sp. REN3 TaxID=2802440 RepID=UPI001AEE07A1|nr:CAP domain-containing protein [Bacillus sp. REN3]